MNALIAKLKGWRTRAFGLLVAVFGFAQSFDWSTVIEDRRTLGLVVGVIGLVVVILREMTTTAPGKSE